MYYEIRRTYHPYKFVKRDSEFIKSVDTEKEAQEHCKHSHEQGVYFDYYQGYEECDY